MATCVDAKSRELTLSKIIFFWLSVCRGSAKQMSQRVIPWRCGCAREQAGLVRHHLVWLISQTRSSCPAESPHDKLLQGTRNKGRSVYLYDMGNLASVYLRLVAFSHRKPGKLAIMPYVEDVARVVLIATASFR